MTGIVNFVRCFPAIKQHCRLAGNVTAMSHLHFTLQEMKDNNYAVLTLHIPILQCDHLYQTGCTADNKTKLEEHKR